MPGGFLELACAIGTLIPQVLRVYRYRAIAIGSAGYLALKFRELRKHALPAAGSRRKNIRRSFLSRELLLLLSKPKRPTAGAMSDSASASSKSIRNTAAADSASITGGFRKRSLPRTILESS